MVIVNFKTNLNQMWSNILSKQLEWYSMKNLVFDFVNNVATQFMICMPPWGALLGSEKLKEQCLRQTTILQQET